MVNPMIFHHYLPSLFLFFLFLVVSLIPVLLVQANTDAKDANSLYVLYGALNNPSQLTGWKSSDGDPCGESWLGVKCDGSAVTSLEIPGLRLNGSMGYLLSDLASLKTLDLSNNNIHDTIPFQMPPNLTTLNLARNNLTGNLPYSISSMASLTYLNVSGNSLTQSIADVFSNHTALGTLDLSSNNFSGDLPASISSLSNLSTLQVQNNQLTGTLNTLVTLPLDNLNVANNQFSGWVPPELLSIPNFVYNGNSFDNGPAPPPPPFTPPPPGTPPKRNHSRSDGAAHSPQGSKTKPSSQGKKKNSSAVGTLLGVVLSVAFLLVFGLLALLFCKRKWKTKPKPSSIPSNGPMSRGNNGNISNGREKANTEIVQGQRVVGMPPAVIDVKTPPSAEIVPVDKVYGKNGSLKRVKSPITATSYTVASLQTATHSFSQENIVGEGSLGRVYRAEFSNGKVLAIKKIDNSALSLQEEDNFLEAVSNMSRLRHPNIVSLAGYCTEHGQRLLVYEYIKNGSLHDILHYSDDESKKLPWNARVRVALGTARALEYLHEVCLPSVVHRNFKSANILLDEEFNPHLSDCGLAALTPNTERQASTLMVGSFGYSAPEFAMSGIYTTKSDVYSFGVVMLELLSGRKPLDSSRPRPEQSLVRWATPQLHDIDALSKMVDPTLNGMYAAKSLSRFADVIALCVQPEPEFRPPMSEVVQALVRLVQRAGGSKRRSGDDSGFGYKTPDHETIDISV